MGTVKLFVTKTFIDNAVSVEANQRSTSDTTLDGRIKSLETTSDSFTSTINTMNTQIANIKLDVEKRVGSTPFSDVLEFPTNYVGTRANGTPYALSKVQDVKEGLNALAAILKNHIDTFDVSSMQTINALNNQMTGYIADFNAQVARIDAILKLAPTEEIDGVNTQIDTFDEVVKLINQLKESTSNNSEFNAYKASVDALIANKADLVQDVNTLTRYIDDTTGIKYKMYVTNGQLAIEDVVI